MNMGLLACVRVGFNLGILSAFLVFYVAVGYVNSGRRVTMSKMLLFLGFGLGKKPKSYCLLAAGISGVCGLLVACYHFPRYLGEGPNW